MVGEPETRLGRSTLRVQEAFLNTARCDAQGQGGRKKGRVKRQEGEERGARSKQEKRG